MSTADAEPVATTLPARYYTDPELFRANWCFYCENSSAGRASQIAAPGDYFLCEMAGESIIITRDSDGSLRAYFNECRHCGTHICADFEGHFPDGFIAAITVGLVSMDDLLALPMLTRVLPRRLSSESRSCCGGTDTFLST